MWQELEAVACGLVVKGGTSSISTFSPIHIAFLVTTTWPRKNLDVLGSELLFVASTSANHFDDDGTFCDGFHPNGSGLRAALPLSPFYTFFP